MFTPPRCPNEACEMHSRPEERFFRRQGSYRPKCRSHPVPRFQCKSCGRGFSRQTFRMDYRDHRPDTNRALFLLLASGMGLRQSARILGMSLTSTQLKFRKIARHIRDLNTLLRGPLPADAILQFDEIESYETCRNTRPVTIPILIERGSRFIVCARSAPIRPTGRMTESRRRAIEKDTAKNGRRQSRSRAIVRWAFKQCRDLVSELGTVILETDHKKTYGPLARALLGSRLRHTKTSSKLPRTTWNPLFPINHMEANYREHTARLRRDTRLASKFRWFLNLQLEIYAAYRNYMRPRFNRDTQTPAEILGFLPRPLTLGELLSWRQDWGSRSLHPLAS